jgi:hypothetical protein
LNRFDTITNNDPFIKSSPAVGIGFMFVPLFDTLRVFMIRISQGKSPFFADRRHMHHFLLDRGWNHRQTSLFLAGMSVFFIFFSLALQNIGSFYLIGILIVIGIAIHFFMEIFKIRNEKV